MKNIRLIAGNDDAQNVYFNNIVPDNAKVLEWQFVFTNVTDQSLPDPLVLEIGTEQYPDGGYHNWVSSTYLEDEDEIVSRDRRSVVSLKLAANGLWLRFNPGAVDWDDAHLSSVEFQFFVSYIDYPVT